MADISLPATAATAVERHLGARRALFAGLVLATITGLLWLAAFTLSDALGGAKILLLALFAVTLPWTVIGFWNGAIGFAIMRSVRDPAAAVLPALAKLRGDEPITASTAILACIRNEAPDHVARNLHPLLAGLGATEAAARFHVYVLSDTDDADIAQQEEARFGALASEWRDRIALTYRRRETNTGYKAGNIRDFCDRWGSAHEFAITLDADSILPAQAALRMVRLMQSQPRLGILQALVVGLPSTSAFARIFQFGMRLGMRSYTVGSAWWQGDCGPYWGHNAALRLKPFIAHCSLPVLPGGVHVLSHDQIEAVLMRRAGYEVRVLAEEDLGWEENPTTLPEFIRRDLRWCQGNMQYWRFMAMPGLKPVSRYQLAVALLMFLGSPAWIGLLVTVILVLGFAEAPVIHPGAGMAVFAAVLAMWFAPQIASALDIVLRADARRAFGGTPRFLAGVAIEVVFIILVAPIMWFSHTMFLAGLPFGRAIGWIGQTRGDHTVPFPRALHDLWPHTAFGLAALAALAAIHPAAIPYALFIAGGPALAIPLAVITARPAVGAMLARIGVGRLPEETAPPAILRELALPALAVALPPSRPSA